MTWAPTACLSWPALILACVFVGGLCFLFGALYAFEQQTWALPLEDDPEDELSLQREER